MTSSTTVGATGIVDLSTVLEDDEKVDDTAPIYVIMTEADGSLTGIGVNNAGTSGDNTVTLTKTLKAASASKDPEDLTDEDYESTGKALSVTESWVTTNNVRTVFVDYYVVKTLAQVPELHITPDTFAGYYYVEADSLMRRQADGIDYPINLTFPNVKIQSNFSIAFSASGDPSTFTFTMDAFPGYTYFDRKHKVLCAIQIVADKANPQEDCETVFPHGDTEGPADALDTGGSYTDFIH